MDWSSIRIGVPGARSAVTFQFNETNVLLASSLFLSPVLADSLLKVLTKLQEFCDDPENKEADPVNWIDSSLKAVGVEFATKGRVVSVNDNSWITTLGDHLK
jgi:hypothetical protein